MQLNHIHLYFPCSVSLSIVKLTLVPRTNVTVSRILFLSSTISVYSCDGSEQKLCPSRRGAEEESYQAGAYKV